MAEITLSVIKADVGGFPGHSRTHPAMLEKAARMLKEQEGRLLIDSFVTHCGDDIQLIMTHEHGEDHPKIHGLAWDVFLECTEIAQKMKLHGAGRDIPSEVIAGNVEQRVSGSAEMTFKERKSDPVLVFMADKANQGAWNFYLYKIFADPFNTPGLVTEPRMQSGFTFEVHDVVKRRKIRFKTPNESYGLLGHIGAPSRYVIHKVLRVPDDEIAAVTSARSQNLITGRNAARGDPVMILRGQSGLPAVGELLEPFTHPVIVAGWMRDLHYGPLMPVGLCDAGCTRFNGPPRVISLGFQLAEGRLIGPVDMFDDPGFDRVRARCNKVADMLRVHGPFEPHMRFPDGEGDVNRLIAEEMFGDRWEPLSE